MDLNNNGSISFKEYMQFISENISFYDSNGEKIKNINELLNHLERNFYIEFSYTKKNKLKKKLSECNYYYYYFLENSLKINLKIEEKNKKIIFPDGANY